MTGEARRVRGLRPRSVPGGGRPPFSDRFHPLQGGRTHLGLAAGAWWLRLEELERARRYDRLMSLIMLDLDNFKAVNDTHGHFVGDEVLKHLAGILGREKRSHDLVGRLGGRSSPCSCRKPPRKRRLPWPSGSGGRS